MRSSWSRSRRSLGKLVALGLVLALVAGACGGDDDDDAAESTPESAEAAGTDAGDAGDADDEGTFPATVEHKHGTTEIPAAPERVVTVGYSDQDYVLAFGVAPVGVTDWYGDHEHATWDWAQDELGDAEPTVLNEGAFTGTAAYNYEEIAALEPDLIIGLYTDMDEEQYGTLSQIAPTVAPSGEYPEYGMPWQETTRVVGAALGRPERAEELITEVDQRFADAAAEHPEFAGLEMIVMEAFEPGSTFARSATDPRTKLMTSLGFVLPDEIAELAGDLDGAEISDEEMELLDRDLLLWNVGLDPELRAQIEAKPLYPGLAVVEAGHSVFVEDPLLSGALTWATVLSLPYAIDELVPLLADALAA
jgi:iron complex transport system substrate-binding protein